MTRQQNNRKKLNRLGKIIVTCSAVGLAVIIMLILFDIEHQPAQKQQPLPITQMSQNTVMTETKTAFDQSPLYVSIKRKHLRKKRKQKRQAERQEEQAEVAKAVTHLEQAYHHHVVYLTFDDSPTRYTDQLLQTLQQYHAKATFFMVGNRMKQRPQIVRNVANAGYSIGLHSMTHQADKVYQSKRAPTHEMLKTQQVLQNITGIKSQMIRLPYGSIPYLTIAMRIPLSQQDFKIWDWNVDSKDWKYHNGRYVQHTIKQIKKMSRKHLAPIILLHDQQETIQYLPELLTYLNEHHYKTKVLSEDMPSFKFLCHGRCHTYG